MVSFKVSLRRQETVMAQLAEQLTNKPKFKGSKPAAAEAFIASLS
jgi:hypothetical protein